MGGREMKSKYTEKIKELEERRAILMKEIDRYNNDIGYLHGLIMVEDIINVYDTPRQIYIN